MKGVIFNLLEECVGAEHGEDTWDALLDAAGLDGAYASLGNYPDEQLFALVGAASTALGVPGDDVVRWFGTAALPRFAERYPGFFDRHPSTRPFLLTLNDVIHPEVRKGFPGATPPVFAFDASDPDVLVMGYSSARALCPLAEGFIEGTATHYGQEAQIEQPSCMRRGDEACELHVRLS